MESLLTTIAMIGWLWTGFMLGRAHQRRAERKSSAYVFALRIAHDLNRVRKLTRFTGADAMTASATSQWKAGELGRFRITVQPVEMTPHQ